MLVVSRGRVMQEIILARSVRVFSGTREISLSKLLDLADLLFSLGWNMRVSNEIVRKAEIHSFPWLVEIKQWRSLLILSVDNPRVDYNYEGRSWEEDNSNWFGGWLQYSKCLIYFFAATHEVQSIQTFSARHCRTATL
jgi:hypothetical protein